MAVAVLSCLGFPASNCKNVTMSCSPRRMLGSLSEGHKVAFGAMVRCLWLSYAAFTMGASGAGGRVRTKKLKAIRVAASVTLIISASTTYAADVAYEAPPLETGWTFTLAPYAWAAGISGDVGLFGISPQKLRRASATF